MIDIKRCPFCGGTDCRVVKDEMNRYTVVCYNLFQCHSEAYCYKDDTPEAAIERWNNRPIEKELQEKLDKAKECLEYISDGEVRYLDILNCYNTKQATKKELKEFARQALKTIRGE